MYTMGMENEPIVPPEVKAFKSFIDWIDEARRVRILFEESGITVPQQVKHALEVAGDKQTSNRPTPLRRPDSPERPQNAKDNWLWIPAKEASARTVFLSVLNEGKPLQIKEIIERMKGILAKPNPGTVYNIAAQLLGKDIEKNTEGLLMLRSGIKAPVLYKGHVWAPASLMLQPDLATFRRMAIEHALRISQGGLQLMQIFLQLQSAEWLKDVPAGKDLIKFDLSLMKKEEKAKQLGNSKKWTLVDEHGGKS